MGKEVKVICPDEAPPEYSFLPSYEKIEKIDFSSFDYKDYDLFIILDSSSWTMVTRDKGVKEFDVKTVVIDHHKSNAKFGDINVVDEKVSSCSEVLYLIFKDWGIEITGDIATCLLTGIIGDTGVFRYPSVTPQTMDVARDLMEKGADKNEIIYHVFSSVDFDLVRFWGEVIRRMVKEGNFIWSAIPYEIFKEYDEPGLGKETAASSFAQIVKDTDFGLIIVEERPKTLAISFRSRSKKDVSVLAERLGGGGHKDAAGAKVEGEYEEALKQILKEAEKFAQENS
jgi:phosphoesterase RecJ-like protein